MPDSNFASGDLVVDLAGHLQSSATITGAIVCIVSIWILKQRAVWRVAGIFLGGIGGFFLGSILGPLFFPAADDMVTVVKLGPGAFWMALKAGLIGGVSAGILASIAPALVTSRTSQLGRLAGTGLVIGIILGTISAYVATRP